MKNSFLKITIIGLFFVNAGACKTVKSTSEYMMDPVCNMKVQTSEAYKYKYDGKRYYFDSYTCKQSFRMNPKKIIENQCSPQK